MIKVAAPNMACRVIDWAIQAFGGAGATGDYGLAYAYATARVLRLADGPDEVHRNQIARFELRKYQGPVSLSVLLAASSILHETFSIRKKARLSAHA
jgi:hypothetical protein